MRDISKALLLVTLLAMPAVFVPAAAQRRLTIIHVNDTHSHLEPLRGGSQSGTGGVIERAAYRDSVVKADGKRNVLLLHAGDFNQGSSYYSVLNGDVEVELVNAMKYDCIALGNHEFDNGIEDLARRLARIKCPVVCANYDFSQVEIGPYVRPYAIVKKAGMKIGIIGLLPVISTLVSSETSSRIRSYDVNEVVNKWADYLRHEKKCDLVIALTHIGYKGGPFSDHTLAAGTRNVDIIVGGHSHTDLAEPGYVDNLDGIPVPIVQDGCWGLRIGNMKVTRKK